MTPFEDIEDEVDEQLDSARALELEKHEAHKVLLDKGLEFEAGGKTFLIKQPYLGTLDYLSYEFAQLDVSAEKLADPVEAFNEAKRSAVNARRCARIVALAVLNSKWKIMWLAWFYTQFFLWTVTPAKLRKLTNIILEASNLQDFTFSITSLSINRTTAPQVIED